MQLPFVVVPAGGSFVPHDDLPEITTFEFEPYCRCVAGYGLILYMRGSLAPLLGISGYWLSRRLSGEPR